MPEAERRPHPLSLAGGRVWALGGPIELDGRTSSGPLVDLRTGGGGGYGDPADRDAAAVQDDLAAGYVSEEAARTAYPHAFSDG